MKEIVKKEKGVFMIYRKLKNKLEKEPRFFKYKKNDKDKHRIDLLPK